MLRRLNRSHFLPRWEDRKHRQTVAGAVQHLLGEDLTDADLTDADLGAIEHRQRRTGSPGNGPQPLYAAQVKVMRGLARRRGVDPSLIARLQAAVQALYCDQH